MKNSHHATHLARHLALLWALLIAYASLHPLSDFREGGGDLLGFLSAPWPRYWTRFDVIANALGYLPLGFLLVPAASPWLRRLPALFVACLLATGLSIGLEVLQHYLPTRVPSNLDVASNALGAAFGALLGARWGGMLGDGGALARWRARRIVRGHTGEFALVLLVLWWLAQIDPDTPLFGLGDLRWVFGLEAPVDFTARRYRAVEIGACICAMVSVGVIGWHSMRARSFWLLGSAFVVALAVKTGSGAVLVPDGGAWLWATPGALAGLAGGAIALRVALWLPSTLRFGAAALALLAGVALVNLAPDNPYPSAVSDAWRAGHFFNFSGLTRLASALWPYFALPYLMALQLRESRGRHAAHDHR
ncbi:VanZ family protein [Methyloversatilis discipulorum]|uniref:VanZ family protein n=1 Tax=Methyloversatilis discipulorum TaxID=1119528 RepID=UPI001A547312|nr:VanZ family protein [Methyloversatilis discipulorum]MBL8467698.1 VanZ family protein [Methyloversatilis discipulorum]